MAIIQELVIFSAKNLAELLEQISEIKKQCKETQIYAIARNSQLNFQNELLFKLSVLASDNNQLIQRLDQVIQKITSDPQSYIFIPNHFYYTYQIEKPKIAFVFAGQGSQYLHMGSEVIHNFYQAQEILDLTNKFSWDPNYSLERVIYPKKTNCEIEKNNQIDLLKQTEWAQPAIGAVTLSQLSILENLGLKAEYFCGHSYGELSALYAAGVIDTAENLLKISRKRGELMSSALAMSGAMTAVSLSEHSIEHYLMSCDANVCIANLNSPEQIVVSGTLHEIKKFEKYLMEKNIYFKRLSVSTAFHSELMHPLGKEFLSYLKDVDLNTLNASTVYSNVTAKPYPNDANQIKEMLSQQLAKPVKFHEQIVNMYEAGVRLFIEIGPNSILTKLIANCLKHKPHYVIALDQSTKNGLSSLWNALAFISVLGIQIKYEAIHSNANHLQLPSQRSEVNMKEFSSDVKMERNKILIEIHNKLSEVQKLFQNTLTESYASYIKSTETILKEISQNEHITTSNNHEAIVSIPNIQTTNNQIDFKTLIFDIISERTGYPSDMLSLEMSLESDLGIDSLKFTEIIVSIQEQFSSKLSITIDSQKLRNIKTIQDILTHISDSSLTKSKNEKKSNQSTIMNSKIERYIVSYEKQKALGITSPMILSENRDIYIVEDNRGVATILRNKFSAVGINATLVTNIPSNATAVISLTGLNKYNNQEEYLNLNKLVFQEALIVAEKMQDKYTSFIIVQDMSFINNTKPLGIDAFAKVAANEWTNSLVKAIGLDVDVLSLENAAQILFDEIQSRGPENAVFYDNNMDRYSSKILASPISYTSKIKQTLHDGDTIVVSGGAYGITAICLLELSLKYKLNIIIIGRTNIAQDVPENLKNFTDKKLLLNALIAQNRLSGENLSLIDLDRKAEQLLKIKTIKINLLKLEENGCTVKYYSEDICNNHATEIIIKKTRSRFDKIDAIIFGAGVIADNYIIKQNMTDFNRVFNTKINGFRNLLLATQHDDLKLICCFSSIASQIGNVGQSNYAMANQVLNKLSSIEKTNRGKNCIVKSINWGPWDSGMVSEALRNYFHKNGIQLISADEGAKVFMNEILHDDENVEVILSHNVSKFTQLQEHYEWLLLLNKYTCPLLADHVIDEAVVPNALVMHWCINLSLQLFPRASKLILSDLKMTKGITVENYESNGKLIKIECKPIVANDETKLVFIIKGRDEQLHYKLNIIIDPVFNLNSLAQAELLQKHNEKWSFSAQNSYLQRKLFVGPSLQVISNLESVSRKGCVAHLCRSKLLEEDINTTVDVTLLDGGIQLALLWRQHYLEQFSLPTSIDLLYIEKVEYIKFPISCHLTIISFNDLFHKVDITYVDDNKNIIAYLKGLCMHVIKEKSI